MTTKERIAAPAEDEWTCLCGNVPETDGFWPSTRRGRELEPVADGEWDGKLVKCLRCQRVMDQSTWDGATVAVVRGARA
jgi:hypothetical protein